MKLARICTLFLAIALLAQLILPTACLAGSKRRVAVMPFEYGAVTSEVGTLDVGKGITSLLVTRLVNDGTYSVVERQMLDAILKEQNLSVSDRADPSTAAKIGKLLGVDAILVGTVTQFGFENKNVNVGAAASAAASYIPYMGGFGFGGLGVKKGKVKVAVDARLVDINTGEIIAVANGSGESKRSGVSLFGGGGGGGGGGSGSFDMGSDGFASSIAGEATLAAVDSVSSQMIAMASRIPDNQSLVAASVQGKIADVTGNTVIVNVGKNNGLKASDHLQAERPYKVVKDPVTGKVLKELTATIGIISLEQVDPESATGTIIRGSGLKVGDTVRKVTTDVSAVILQPVPNESSRTTINASGSTRIK
jgi:curli biogenesis system outer membrane secretion channel CsgG